MSTTSSIATRYTARYGVRHPFACAGMAFAGMTPDLAIAVSKAGGIGSLGVGFTPPQLLREYVRTIRAATDAPFHVNFITCFDNDPQVRVCAEEHVPIVSWHWGHPSRTHRQLLRDAGVAYWEQVGSIDDARRAVDAGAEVVIARVTKPAATTSCGGGSPRRHVTARCTYPSQSAAPSCSSVTRGLGADAQERGTAYQRRARARHQPTRGASARAAARIARDVRRRP